MYKYLVVVCCTFIAHITTFGQVTQRNILGNAYNLNQLKEHIVDYNEWKPFPKTAAGWRQKILPERIEFIIKNAERALAEPVPPVNATLIMEYVRTGNRENFQQVSYARRNNLLYLALAEAVEEKGRFLDAALNYLWAICEETYWGVPAHLSVQKTGNGLPDVNDPTVDLFGAETAALLGWVEYMIGERLQKISPLIRQRMYTETKRKIFDPIKMQNRYSWLSSANAVNNWNPWIISNVLTANLILEKDDTTRAANTYLYMQYLDKYFNGLGNDGGCDEGPSYWTAAGASALEVLEILKQATGGLVDIYNNPLIKNMAAYIYKVHIGGNFFLNFADADPEVKLDGYMICRFARVLNDTVLNEFGKYFILASPGIELKGHHRYRRLCNLLTEKELGIITSHDYTVVNDSWINDIQVFAARSKNGLYIAGHGGHNAESHNHNDVGDFIVYANDEPVIIDAGRGNYTSRTFSSKRYELWFTRSEYHNLPVVNGYGQKAGRKFAATEVQYTSNQKYSSLNMDIGAAYPPEAGIEKFNRTLFFDKVSNKAFINDSYRLTTAPALMEQVFMTICDIDTATPGQLIFTTRSGKKVQLGYDRKKWNIEVDFPAVDGPEYNSFKTKWGKGSVIKRLVFKAKEPKKTASYSFVIEKK